MVHFRNGCYRIFAFILFHKLTVIKDVDRRFLTKWSRFKKFGNNRSKRL